MYCRAWQVTLVQHHSNTTVQIYKMLLYFKYKLPKGDDADFGENEKGIVLENSNLVIDMLIATAVFIILIFVIMIFKCIKNPSKYKTLPVHKNDIMESSKVENGLHILSDQMIVNTFKILCTLQ